MYLYLYALYGMFLAKNVFQKPLLLLCHYYYTTTATPEYINKAPENIKQLKLWNIKAKVQKLFLEMHACTNFAFHIFIETFCYILWKRNLHAWAYISTM